jgi:hypothetical protein
MSLPVQAGAGSPASTAHPVAVQLMHNSVINKSLDAKAGLLCRTIYFNPLLVYMNRENGFRSANPGRWSFFVDQVNMISFISTSSPGGVKLAGAAQLKIRSRHCLEL